MRGGLLLIVLAFASLTPLPTVRALDPAPNGGYPRQNTAEGIDALFSLTTGFDNTALGFHTLYNNTAGHDNTATGDRALFNNATGSFNTALGFGTLFSNTTGSLNTANGGGALYSNAADMAVGTQAVVNDTLMQVQTGIS